MKKRHLQKKNKCMMLTATKNFRNEELSDDSGTKGKEKTDLVTE